MLTVQFCMHVACVCVCVFGSYDRSLAHLQICGCHGDYTLVNREEACIEMIRKKVGNANVLVSTYISLNCPHL